MEIEIVTENIQLKKVYFWLEKNSPVKQIVLPTLYFQLWFLA